MKRQVLMSRLTETVCVTSQRPCSTDHRDVTNPQRA